MRILIAGDYCPQHRVIESIKKQDYESVLGEVKPIVELSDYAILNLECPVTYGTERPIEKCGPNLSCPPKGLEAIKWSGFDCVTLANNHYFDYGEEGVKNTLAVCEGLGIDTVGGGVTLGDASRILYKKIDGETLAIINCCEHEFSIATKESGGSNPLNPISQYYDIKEAKENANFVIVIVHGGHEHYQLPSPRMKETYRFFIDAGADAVVNHHQHCFSGYEIYHNKPIFYGLGNFCFDNQLWRASNWNLGYMVCIDTNNITAVELIPYSQCDDNSSVSLLKGLDVDHFYMATEKLNETILDDERLLQAYSDYLSKGYQYVLMGFEPYNNSRISRSLYIRKLLPSFLSKKKLYWLINYIGCESHNSRVLAALMRKIAVQR